MSNRAALALILLLFISHLPFLTADPDRDISFSRGPFTDEGLNTIQVRNFINQGRLDVDECDNLLKTPAFGAMVGSTMLLFGTKLWVGRLTVLLFIMLSLAFLSKHSPFREIILLVMPILLFKYQLFQFSHFSLAEIPAVMATVLGIYFIYKAYRPFRLEKEYILNSVLAGTFLSLAWYFKIQFIYLLPLGPLIAVERAFFAKSPGPSRRWMNGLIITGTTLFFILFYLLAWYLPFKETYDYMMANQSGSFTLSGKTMEYIRFNLSYFIFSDVNRPFTILFLACLAAGIFLLFRRTSAHFPVLFKASLAWLLLETHKLTMVYLPTRYQVSLYAAMGLVTAIVLAELWQHAPVLRSRFRMVAMRSAVVVASLAMAFINFLDYQDTYLNRTYQIRDANRYLARTLQPSDLAIGAWAPSLTWDAGCRAWPVWYGFLNDKEPLASKPRIVVSEFDEEDSEQAYQHSGIKLESVSDSIRSYHIGNWQVNIYWLSSSPRP